MYDDNNLSVDVNKEHLLDILRANRDKHEVDYEKAKVGFRKLLERELEKKLENLRAGKKVPLHFKNQKPDSHIKDYEDIIGMLEMATKDELKITHTQYKQWVQDDWHWKNNWMTSNAMYVSAA